MRKLSTFQRLAAIVAIALITMPLLYVALDIADGHAAQQTINIGTTANDGTGDTLRSAFDKVNDNFTEVYAAGGELTGTLPSPTIVRSITPTWTGMHTFDAGLTFDATAGLIIGGDADTKIYSSVADTISIDTGGVKQWDILSSGGLRHKSGLDLWGGLLTTAVGQHALEAGASSVGNTAIGYGAMRYTTTGLRNVAIGGNSLADPLYNSNQSVAVGYDSLKNLESGALNTAVGYQAGLSLLTGDRNVFLGYGAAILLTNGTANIYIGNDVRAPTPTESNTLVIGNLLFGTGIDGTGTTISSGNIGIATRGPDRKLDVLDNSGSAQLRLTHTDGSVYTDLLGTANGLTVTGSSSSRVTLGASGPQVIPGSGSPEGAITAVVGSLFLRTDGGASTTLYVKESGAGNTGWIAK